MPFQTLLAEVTYIALQTTMGELQSTAMDCYKPDDDASELISNLTGCARIYGSRVSRAEYAMRRVWHSSRAETWS